VNIATSSNLLPANAARKAETIITIQPKSRQQPRLHGVHGLEAKTRSDHIGTRGRKQQSRTFLIAG
jgi:hypothetical protein